MQISRKIVDYAIWYYLRYYPSTKKLEQKLIYKFGVDSEKGKKYKAICELKNSKIEYLGFGKEEVNYIINEKLRNIIQEEEVCRAKINNLLNKSKNYFYIKNNLRQKLFDSDLIEEILKKEFNLEEESLLNKEKILKKILILKNKGKSINYSRNKFVERSLDKEIVEEVILEVYGDSDLEELEKEYNKIKNNKNIDRKKIIEKLLRKGFKYDDIKNVF